MTYVKCVLKRVHPKQGQPYLEWAFLGLLTDKGAKMHHFPKTCHTYPKMMKLSRFVLCLKKTQKPINQLTHPLFQHQHFFIGNHQLLFYQEIQI